jgi:hypothetical protein
VLASLLQAIGYFVQACAGNLKIMNDGLTIFSLMQIFLFYLFIFHRRYDTFVVLLVIAHAAVNAYSNFVLFHDYTNSAGAAAMHGGCSNRYQCFSWLAGRHHAATGNFRLQATDGICRFRSLRHPCRDKYSRFSPFAHWGCCTAPISTPFSILHSTLS